MLMAESEEELKRLLMKVKEESGKIGLKLNIQKTKIMSMGFSRQVYWNVLPFPSPGHLPNPGTESGSPTLQVDSLVSEPPGKPQFYNGSCFFFFFGGRVIHSTNIKRLSLLGMVLGTGSIVKLTKLLVLLEGILWWEIMINNN